MISHSEVNTAFIDLRMSSLREAYSSGAATPA